MRDNDESNDEFDTASDYDDMLAPPELADNDNAINRNSQGLCI